MPKSRVEFWQKKFDDNVRRDAVVRQELEKREIKCLIIWECTIRKMMKDSTDQFKTIDIVKQFFNEDNAFLEL